jgi:signal recognition particle receptor subunit beta
VCVVVVDVVDDDDDAGGQKKLRQLWQYYLKNTQALVFVVDSADRERLPEAKEELRMLMERPELVGGVLLVLANKQDMPHALPPEEIARKLKLKRVARKTTWHIQGTVGTTGNGLYEAIDWLATALRDHEAATSRRRHSRTTWRFVRDPGRHHHHHHNHTTDLGT